MDGEFLGNRAIDDVGEVLHGEQSTASDFNVPFDVNSNLKALIKQRDSLINQLCTKIVKQCKVIQELEVELTEKKSEIHKLKGEISMYKNDKTSVVELLNKMKIDITGKKSKTQVDQDSKGIIKTTNKEINKTLETQLFGKCTKTMDQVTQVELIKVKKCMCGDLEVKISSCKKSFKNLKENFRIIINTNSDLRNDIKKLMDENKILINAFRYEHAIDRKKIVENTQIGHKTTNRFLLGFNSDKTYNIEHIISLKEKTIFHLEIALQREKELNNIFVKLLKHVL